MQLEEPQDGRKGKMKRKNRASKATRQLSHRAGAHDHCEENMGSQSVEKE